MAKCTGHRDCVKACGAIGAIDFSRTDTARSERFDLVLDLSARRCSGRRTSRRAISRRAAIRSSRRWPRRRSRSWWANSRSRSSSRTTRRSARIRAPGSAGCNKCIDVCSTGAIRSAGDKVEVNPHLCAGCGGCATVCPSGAMTYAYPRVPETGARLKRALSAYREAGGSDAAILFHNGTAGRELVARARPPRQGPAGARDSARVLTRAVARHRRDARRDRLRREPGVPGRRPDTRPTITPRRCRGRWATRRRSSTRWATPGRTSTLVDAGRRARARGAPVVGRAGRDRAAPGDVQPVGGKAHHARVRVRASGEARAGAAVADSARPGRALRRAGRGQGELHAVPGVRRRLSRVGAARHPGSPAPALHRAQLRAVRPVREYLPGGRPPLVPRLLPRRDGEGAGDAERGGAVPLRALRQALRHPADGRQHDGQARRPLDVRRAGRAEAPA